MAQTRTLEVTSTGFAADEPMPRRFAYRGEGDNVSPPIFWEGVPEGARELALICDDPDAPRAEPWVHWVVYRIPPSASGLPQGLPGRGELEDPQGLRQGRNSWDELGWGGPFPPPGHGTHHYRFRLYALERRLDLPPGATKEELLRAMEGHVLTEGELVGTYERS